MWKTRFEISPSYSKDSTRHRNLSSSSSIIHHYYSGSLPTVPRVRDDSPSAIVRPTPPSSIPNLGILTEEDEDLPCSSLNNNEQPSLVSITVRKQNSSQYQFVLPTIVESNDQEIMIEHEQNSNEINVFDTESVDDRYNRSVKLKEQDSFVATNTNYNQGIHVDLERKTTTTSNQMIEFTLDRRIKDLLQEKNKSTSSSIDVNKPEISIPTTFKDISAFFENKASATFPTKISEQKKMIRAKRSLLSNRQISLNNNDLTKLEIISSATEKESTRIHHRIKRIKTTDKSEFDSIIEPELVVNNGFAKRSIKSKTINNITKKKTLTKRWFISFLFMITILIYFYLSNLTKMYKDSLRLNPLIYLQNSPSKVLSQQFNEPIQSVNENIISRYGHFIRNHFFSSLDILITSLGQLFFHIDKYEYKNNIIYVVTSTYEHIYHWFIRNIFESQR